MDLCKFQIPLVYGIKLERRDHMADVIKIRKNKGGNITLGHTLTNVQI